MSVIIFCLLSLYTAQAHIVRDEYNKKPNIVIIAADDMGWDDISLHGSDQILTSNIDMLGYQGIILFNYYTDCQGTPSRSALFTGKYPMKMGTQGPSIGVAEDRGVPISEQLLPTYLKDLGYVSHLVGKWELGKSRDCYLPMRRGFDTFYGFTGSSVDYYTYNHVETVNGTEFFGLDLFDGFNPVYEQGGQKHLTNLLTDRAVKIIEEHNTSVPLYLHVSHAAAHVGGGMVNLQASGEDVSANSHIAHSARRLYAGLVTGVDKSVGKIVGALAEKQILNNTIIIFVCDNGAQSIGLSRNYGSNLPLRGTKGTPWEGAVRSTAILWHADINPKIWEGLFHVTDWLPTLVAAAGGDTSEYGLDGLNQWDSLTNDHPPKRNQTVIAVDDLKEWGAFREGDMKMIVGTVPPTCGYYGEELNKIIPSRAPDYVEKLLTSNTSKVFTDYLEMSFDIADALTKRDFCNLNNKRNKTNDTVLEIREICVPTKLKGCLFNITADPEESQDLWDKYPKIVLAMTLRFQLIWSDLVPRRPPTFDPRSDPALNGYVWRPWRNDDDEELPPLNTTPLYPMKITPELLDYYVDLNLEVLKNKLSIYMKSLADAFVNSVSSIL